MVINTNIEAMQNANNLNMSATGLAKSLARLSSGSKIVNPSDDAAGLAVASRLQSQITRIDAALSNVINAVSLIQTQDGFMKTIDKALSRMGELAMLAQDATKSEADRSLYHHEFVQLKDYISATGLKEYNSASLFSTATIAVTVDAGGTTFVLDGTPIVQSTATTYAAVLGSNSNLTSISFAQATLLLVNAAGGQIAQDRARLGAYQARLNFTSEQLTITKENLASAVSRIADTNVAEESTRYARSQILVQSGTTMLTQANSLPNTTLRLLQS